ncbi:Galactose-3-O-sulfotransferase [Loktanella sp. DSM 29012]|uniref:sulfotransferase family 2 domain-containing protein n=1 Tax=Loktanella sp. DSM 29012 TaxID=1881056 RepID=UPI0008BAA6CA|nr:sulfotransferase family 2 domain-containing protein [Loktanella sp. DSM 29012]SEQ78487.1 Galactose-3-O-sulfotransferase [Loktanella sp. DSM 29012]
MNDPVLHPLSPRLDPQTFAIFLHIQKTAGITVQTYLRQRFGPGSLRRMAWRLTRDPRLAGDLRTAARARKTKDRMFGGHFCFGIHRDLPAPASYMTYLRDPVARFVSLYTYSRDTPTAYYHSHARDRDLASFVRDSGLLELDNGMVRFIAGSDDGSAFINRTPVGGVDDAMLATAKRNLETAFFFTGIQERFDESFLLLGHLLGDARPRYLRLNTTRSGAAPVLDPDTLRAIQDRSQMDRALYDFACQRLDAQLAATFDDLEGTLAQFRTANARYNARMAPLHNALASLRPRSFSAG